MIYCADSSDFVPLNNDKLKDLVRPEHGLAAMRPIDFVGGDTPSALLATGRRDRRVDPGDAVCMAERQRSLGCEAKVGLYDRVYHRPAIGAFVHPRRFPAPALDVVVAFARPKSRREALLFGTARDRIA